jgi:hypothetical protein
MSKLTTRRVRFRRLREIALLLEKFAIFAAIALLTYALIVLDTRAATADPARMTHVAAPVGTGV